MYLLGFCLLAVVSGWVAWRNNPMFSVRSTLRFLLAVGLMLAVFIGVMIQVSQYSVTHPGPVAYMAIGATVVFGTIAFIWVIIVASTPKSAPLPKTAKMLTPNRQKVWKWAKRFLWTVLALAVLEAVLRGTAQIVVGTFGGMFVFVGIVLLFTGYVSARQMDRWLSAVEDTPWIHWSYTAEQWQRWTDVEVGRTSSMPAFQWGRNWYKFALPVVGIAAGVAIFSPGSWLFKGLYVAGVTALLVVMIVAGQRSDRNKPERLRSQLAGAEPEVYFGQEGVFADGVFTPWLTSGVYLLGAWLDERAPRSLVLRFEKIVVGSTGSGSSTVDICAPVPENAAQDLARLQQELTARCPKADVRLV
jgi:hypothetical protein